MPGQVQQMQTDQAPESASGADVTTPQGAVQTMAQPPAAPATATNDVPASGASTDSSSSKSKKVVHLPTDALGRIRKEAADKGKRAAQAEFESRLKALGYDSLEEIGAKKAPSKKAANDNARPTVDDSQQSQNQVENRRRMQMRLNNEIKARRKAERERDRLEVMMELKVAAAQVGIKHIDFAVDMLQKQMKGKSEQELAGFDEVKYFTGLKESHPYLFHAEQQLATTSPAGQQAREPAPSSPAASTQKAVDEKSIDARKMSKDDFDALLRKHGLTNPASMM